MEIVSEIERMERQLARYIEKKFVVAKMKHWFVVSIAVGLILSAVYCFCYNIKYLKLFSDTQYDERLLVSNYNGNYLSYPETTRCAIWDIRVKKDVMDEISKNPAFDYQDYLHKYGDILVERLNSLWSREALYETIKEESIFGEFDFSPFEINDVFGGAFLYSAQTLGINVTAPFAYQSTLELSSEQMVFARDTVFDIYTALLDDDTYYADLPIYLIRKSSQIEEGLSEQMLVYEVLKEIDWTQGTIQFPKKRLFFCFVLGMMAVEMIVFLLAVRDDRVKSVKELKSRTDLVMIDVTNEVEMDAYCNEGNNQESGERKDVAYLYNRNLSAELTEKILSYMEKKYAFRDVTVFSTDTLLKTPKALVEGDRIIIPITMMKTTYHELAEIAEELNQYSIEVHAIVLRG